MSPKTKKRLEDLPKIRWSLGRVALISAANITTRSQKRPPYRTSSSIPNKLNMPIGRGQSSNNLLLFFTSTIYCCNPLCGAFSSSLPFVAPIRDHTAGTSTHAHTARGRAFTRITAKKGAAFIYVLPSSTRVELCVHL